MTAMPGLNSPTVSAVAEAYLCCSCGACAAACPEDAILYQETPGGYLFPEINRDLCTECGKCLRVCPGIRFAADLPEDPFAGEALGCWIGKASDETVYAGSQSGGAVTAILLSLMSEGAINGAVTVTMETGAPPRPRVHISRSPGEILSAQGSKYCPAPVLASLRDLSGESGPFALVGLGCQVQGLHNLFTEFPDLRRKITPVIGLICERTMTCGAIDYFLHRAGIQKGRPVSLRYKSKERGRYPGDVRICEDGGEAVFLPGRERARIKDFFTPARCRLCFDKMNVLSDITAGDPWGIAGADRTRGESLLIARTPSGLEIVNRARDSLRIDLRELGYQEALSGQKIDQKRKDFSGYSSAWHSRHRELPQGAVFPPESAHIPEHGNLYLKNLDLSLALDRFASPEAMIRGARLWAARKKMAAKLGRIVKSPNPIPASGQAIPSGRGGKGRPVNIEILGVNYNNKGAHLMLIAAVEELSRSLPEARVALCLKKAEKRGTGHPDIYRKAAASETFFGDLSSRLRFNRKNRGRLKMILDSEIDATLDASGFKYSDQFGHRSIAERAKLIKNWKKGGRKIILLPQAFGPFEVPRVRKAVKTIADHADLIFPRDMESYNHLADLVGKRENIRIFPDFTNLVQGKRPDYFNPVKPRACIIPNTQMIERTTPGIARSYVPFFADCARFLREADLDPFILLHEMEKDGALAREVRESSGIPLEIIRESDPLSVKGIIGACRLVVGSRYHALINALSQGVPAVATGWSHKYEHLMKEWGCPELLVSDLTFRAQAADALGALTDPQKYDEIAARLDRSRLAMAGKTREMWREVIEVVSR